MSTALVSVFLGERDVVAGRPAFDVLGGIVASHPVRAAILLRGHGGFGPRHALQTDQSLSLSEDLPLTWAVAAPAATAHRLAHDVAGVMPHTLVTVAPVTVIGEGSPPSGAVRLTLFARRGRRPEGPAALRALTSALHGAGVDAALVLAGVDGVRAGVRRPGRLLVPSPATPVAVTAVCDASVAATVVAAARAPAGMDLAVVEPLVTDPSDDPLPPPSTGGWHALSVYVGPHGDHGADVRCRALAAALRGHGVRGATVLLGTWGYGPGGSPDGDHLLRVRRGIPGLVVAVDRPERLAPVADLVTGPAMRAAVHRVAVVGAAAG